MRKLNQALAGLAAAAALTIAAATSASAAAPPGVPGEPSCFGHTHADIAQDSRSSGIPSEPNGFGPTVEFFGFTTQSANADISAECAAP
jgi:hypothetical protein